MGVAIFGLTVAAHAATYVVIDETAIIGKSGGSGGWRGNYTSTHTAAGQIILGVATYGRSFTRVVNGDNGLFGTHSGDNNGSATEPVWFYYDILSKAGTVYRPGDDPLADPLSRLGAQTMYGPYKFDGSLFIGYDDARLVKQKARYIVDQNHGGSIFWEFRFDASSQDSSLFDTAKAWLR